jgi:hypothetical protein
MTSLSASVSARMRRQGLLDDLLVFDVEEAASRSRRDGGLGTMSKARIQTGLGTHTPVRSSTRLFIMYLPQ